ncbi:microprocessor complex subunit DGCR8 [Ischnura elegans]|uniref:microprocessor complex subunit DGCR8 n=1 Tax=Ischnura elegans TaxID=197161 RepID=UPI001ED88F54|nr:microprocessor complex subunit DGCR8 [Ischnura elegans]XP_046385922.1 microprocessor complex subunit DGCR8 [Ischnura elegans]
MVHKRKPDEGDENFEHIPKSKSMKSNSSDESDTMVKEEAQAEENVGEVVVSESKTNSCEPSMEDGEICDDLPEEEEEDSDDDRVTNQQSFTEGTCMSREFDVLDEYGECNEGNDNEGDEDGVDDGDDSVTDVSFDGSFDSDIPDEEIEAMLEEGLNEEFRKKQPNDGKSYGTSESSPYEEREKVVLEEKGHNHFDVLPEGWVQVTHNSGMPIYLHKPTRVCTLSKPYFLGPGSARKHEVPLSGIPCLQYRRALEKEQIEKRKNIKDEFLTPKEPCENGLRSNGDQTSPPALPSARIETAQENKAQQSLSYAQVQEYCKKLFHFKTIKVLRFKSWSARRKFTKQRKRTKQLQRPTLPEGTKLITFPIQSSGSEADGVSSGTRSKKEWIMNPSGKSYVCILHEYVQHALKKQPCYQFKELENAGTPYAATVIINGMQYGMGYGTSKKQAKSEAARATLEILIPEMRDKIREDAAVTSQGGTGGRSVANTGIVGSNRRNSLDEPDLSLFDEIKIEDPRVAELCAKTNEPPPYAILLTCIQRNFGLGEMQIKYEVNTLRHQKNEFTMTVNKHTAKVVCKNKRDGKQRASQAILQVLHPHVSSWGSLLRLYGNRSVKSIKEKKQEEQEITLLQSKASVNSPNFAILAKLKQEMKKLRDMRVAIQPIGKFIPPDDVDLPSSSGADLNNVDL